MTNGEQPQYRWSDRANQFYQVGRRGAVSREQALGGLRQNEAGNWTDSFGKEVPALVFSPPRTNVRRFVGHDSQGRPFVSASFSDKLIDPQQYEGLRLQGNQMLVVRTVVRTPEGKLIVSYYTSKLGARVDREFYDGKANARASGELRGKGFEVGTNKIDVNTVSRTYEIRTVTSGARL